MSQLYRWGIIGAGRIAAEFAHGLGTTSHSVPAKVASRRAQSASTLAAALGNCEAVASPADLIDAPDIDIIYLATPNTTHTDLAERCLSAGKHVLIEKPITTTADEARHISEVAAREGRFCMEALWTRFLPISAELKRIVDSGEIGAVTYVHAELGEPVSFAEGAGAHDDASGGALLDLGVYPVSMVQWLLGKPKAVHGAVQSGRDARRGTRVAATLEFDGALATFAASHDARLSNTMTVVGERGRIEIDAPFFRSMRGRVETFAPAAVGKPDQLLQAGGPKRALKDTLIRFGVHPAHGTAIRSLIGRNGQTISAPYTGYGYQFEANEVVRCIGAGLIESPVMPLQDSIEVMEILDRIRQC